MNCSSRCRASITDLQRATRALWERPCAAQSPHKPPCRSGFTREYGSGGNGERRVEIGQQGRPFRG
ncbi:hypothetical protein DM483_05405 [Pseudomonas sp. SMT-1]|nr:hypothetical protein DM483_05405 [Pseudomonas sp. SMT-1]